MHVKYKIIFIILLSFSYSFLFSEGGEKYITFISNIDSNLKDNTKKIGKYLIDITEAYLYDRYKGDLIIKNIKGEVESWEVEDYFNYIFSHGIDSFYFFKISEEKDNIKIDIKLYDSLRNIIYENVFLLSNKILSKEDRFILLEKEKEWFSIIDESSQNIFKIKEKAFKSTALFSKYSFQHDFPYINIGVNAVSGKMFFDDRMFVKSHKLFSFFPFEIRATVFPVKYFETGLLFRINFDNLVYKYYDNDKKKYDFFDMGVTLNYGFFIGLSFFNDTTHYSIGLEFYNIYYDISYYPEWKKTDDYRSNFLPQIALYQKVDFKLFKFLYYSIIFRFGTIPKFEVENNTFHSNPFSYDFFVAEISIVGLSIMF
jgi:hypothetical protein